MNAIEATGLTKRFGTTQALDGVDLAAREGTVLGVLGPERRRQDHRGAGAGHPAAGRRRPGHASTATTSSRTPPQVRRTIGLTGQYASVDEDLTGTQNLVMIGQLLNLSTRDAKARAAELLDWFGLADAAGARPRPTPAACAAGSTSPPAWSAGRG